MTPKRKEHLYNQYVLAITNNGHWHNKAIRHIRPGGASAFYNLTYEYIRNEAVMLNEREPNDLERAYIYLGCWRYYGGTATMFMRGLDPNNSMIARAVTKLLAEERASQQPASQPEPSREEPAVNNTNATIAFETRHFVYGLDVANMSAGQLIEAIKKIEAEIADLKSVKSKSEHIKKRIAELEDMLAKVVQVLDSK